MKPDTSIKKRVAEFADWLSDPQREEILKALEAYARTLGFKQRESAIERASALGWRVSA